MLIQTTCDVLHPVEKKTVTTNTFYFTYECKGLSKTITPTTYEEAILWLEGRRKIEKLSGDQLVW